MKTDELLLKEVQDVIQWETLLKAREIVVTVNEGVVTLNGTVDNFGGRAEAENAVANVAGIVGVVDNLRIKKNRPRSKQKSLEAKSK